MLHLKKKSLPLNYTAILTFFFILKDDSLIISRSSNVQHVRNSIKNDSVIILAMKNSREISHEKFFLY